MQKENMTVRDRPARLSKRLTEEQRAALADALLMEPEEIEPTNALAALYKAAERGRGDSTAAIHILLEAGILVEVRPA
jgi:hypothetical protein